MDLRHLRYFIAVAEEGNVGRAASRLHISQPPLTRQIQQLEAELGVALFIRTPRGMEMTEAGAHFLDEARNICSVLEQATERTQRAGQGKLGRLDIAVLGSSILDAIPKLLQSYKERFPDVKIVLHTMNKHEQVEALRQRRITVGFNRLLMPFPDITEELVTMEALMLAVNISNPLAQLESVPFTKLADHPLVLFPNGARPSFLDTVMGLCQSAGFMPQISQEVGDTITSVALVSSGFGVCLVPESACNLTLPNVVYLPVTGLPEPSRLDLSCMYRSDNRSPILAAFLEVVRDFRAQAMAQIPTLPAD